MTLHSPFARLFNSSAARAETDQDVQERKRREAEGDLSDNEEAGDEGDEEDEEGEADAADAKKKARRAKAKKKAAEGDDDSDEVDDNDPKAKAARARERGRIRAILASPGAQRDPVRALDLAVSSNASRQSVIDTLGAGPRQSAAARERLSTVGGFDVGGIEDERPAGSAGTARTMIALYRQARGMGGSDLADAIVRAGRARRES